MQTPHYLSSLNKTLLEHLRAHSLTQSLWFLHATTIRLNIGTELEAHIPKLFACQPFTKTCLLNHSTEGGGG